MTDESAAAPCCHTHDQENARLARLLRAAEDAILQIRHLGDCSEPCWCGANVAREGLADALAPYKKEDDNAECE